MDEELETFIAAKEDENEIIEKAIEVNKELRLATVNEPILKQAKIDTQAEFDATVKDLQIPDPYVANLDITYRM